MVSESSAGFLSDVASATRTILSEPLLPLATVVLAGLAAAPVIGVFASLPLVGFMGTQQVWFLRLRRGKTLSWDETRRFTWRFLGRYLCLGLAVGLPLTFIALTLGPTRTSTRIALGVVGFAAEVALTFVVPALALTTRSFRQAIRVGINLLRDHWPKDAWYAIAPPLLLQAGFGPIARAVFHQLAIRLFLTTVVSFVSLVLRCAIVQEYVRLVPVDDDGATQPVTIN